MYLQDDHYDAHPWTVCNCGLHTHVSSFYLTRFRQWTWLMTSSLQQCLHWCNGAIFLRVCTVCPRFTASGLRIGLPRIHLATWAIWAAVTRHSRKHYFTNVFFTYHALENKFPPSKLFLFFFLHGYILEWKVVMSVFCPNVCKSASLSL